MLSLQHVRRIIAVLRSSSTAGGGWEGWVEGVICWYKRSNDLPLARSLWKAHASTVSGYCFVIEPLFTWLLLERI